MLRICVSPSQRASRIKDLRRSRDQTENMRTRPIATAVLLGVAAVMGSLAISPVSTQAQSVSADVVVPASPVCNISPQQARFALPLRKMARRLLNGQPIKIVALGSSSTYGAGASSSAAAYP